MEIQSDNNSESELDLSSKSNDNKPRKNDNFDKKDVSIGLNSSMVKPSVSLDPPTLIPPQSSISSLLSLNHHHRLWTNPLNVSAVSAAAMTHLIDINNTVQSQAIGKSGKSTDDQPNQTVNGNMCMICGRVAQNQSELERHMLIHSMQKLYQCVKCDKTFKNLRNQQSHQFLFHNITDGMTPNRMQGLLITQKKRKSKSSNSLCLSDDSKSSIETSLEQQMKNFECNLLQSFGMQIPNSNANSISISDIQKSISSKINNSMNTNTFPCTSCHKTFATEVDLKAHLMRHLTQHPFVCLACGKGFKYEHSLNFHIKSYHGVNNNNNLVSSSSKNKNNKNKLEEKEEKTCSTETAFVTSYNENTHGNERMDYDAETSIDGEESNDYNDDDTTEEDLIQQKHKDNNNINISFDYGAPANFAPKSVQIKSEKVLITILEGFHPVTEQSYVLYKCCLCGFAFPSLEPVTLHIQSSHLNTNKEFTCDKCGAAFKWRSELQLHEQLHKVMDQHEKTGQFSIPSFMQPNFVFMNTDLGLAISPQSNSNNSNNNNNNNNNNISIDWTKEELDKKIKIEISEKILENNKLYNRKNDKTTTTTTKRQKIIESKDSNLNLLSQIAFPTQKFPSPAVGDIEETAPGQFKCRFCDKTFDRIFSVHRHERVHTGFKPCICKTCGRGFSEKRNLRHHIIRFHSDGSGRELLKRNRKDKNQNNNKVKIDRRKLVTTLKKTALKILNSNGTESSPEKNSINKKFLENNQDTKDDRNNNLPSGDLVNNGCSSSSYIVNNDNNNNTITSSSSSRRRKGRPSKKIITAEVLSPESIPNEEDRYEEEEEEEEEINNENQKDENMQEQETETENKDDEEVEGSSSPDINPSDFLETKLRCHGAFFSSYNPRLGVVDKPVKRTDACKPLLGPDGKYLYPCSYCNKTFCSLSDLNRHMNFHEDVRPFKCEYCNYQSRTNSQLKVHMMRHAGIKQFLCQVCNYNGVTQSDLNRHCKTRSHSLRSTNICPLCALGFSTRTLLDDHILKFHESESTSSVSSDKSNGALITKNESSKDNLNSEHNNNDYSFQNKKFSVNEILN